MRQERKVVKAQALPLTTATAVAALPLRVLLTREEMVFARMVSLTSA
jgi:hypothetical protein